MSDETIIGELERKLERTRSVAEHAVRLAEKLQEELHHAHNEISQLKTQVHGLENAVGDIQSRGIGPLGRYNP